MYFEATARARAGRKARQGTQPQRRKKPAGMVSFGKVRAKFNITISNKSKNKKV
jgi:hypothetical protein